MSSFNLAGITIGPIVRTIKQQRRLKSMFATSYLFSVITRELLIELSTHSEYSIIVPDIKNLEKEHLGVGIYPDRIIFKSQNDILPTDLRKRIINKVLDDVRERFLKKYDGDSGTKYHISSAYFKSYINVKFDILQDLNLESGIKNLSKRLDSIDYKQTLPVKETFELRNYFGGTKSSSPLLRDAFGSQFQEALPSLMQLCLSDFKDKNIFSLSELENDEKDYYSIILESKQDVIRLKKHHKYFALVMMDGDNMGSQIPSMSDNIEPFNDFMWNFGTTATKIIKENHGIPIYIGGDDLFFLTPMATQGQTVFQTVEKIHKCFLLQKLCYSKNEAIQKMELSTGISINYYKHPLSECIEQVTSELKRSKNFEIKKGKKNALSVNLRLESNQVSAFTVSRYSENSFTIVMDMLHKALHAENIFLHGVIQDIEEMQEFYKVLLSLRSGQGSPVVNYDYLLNFIQNTYNEEIHEGEHNDDKFLGQLAKLLINLKEDGYGSPLDQTINMTTSLLRIIDFIKAEPNQEYA